MPVTECDARDRVSRERDERATTTVKQACWPPNRGVVMRMNDIPFGTTDWSSVERTEHKGETGVAYWRTQNFGDIRVRMVEYSPGYRADHCQVPLTVSWP